jgi:hypothetical protein
MWQWVSITHGQLKVKQCAHLPHHTKIQRRALYQPATPALKVALIQRNFLSDRYFPPEKVAGISLNPERGLIAQRRRLKH